MGQGEALAEVCDGFARQPVVASALEATAGKGVALSSSEAEPERVVNDLKAAGRAPQSGKSRMKGIPFCTLESAKDGKNVLSITFREALAIPRGQANTDGITSYGTGARATSSDSYASIYFACRMEPPAHEIVVAAELERADENEADHEGLRDDQMTLANAAARRVADALGCQDPRLAVGAPARGGSS
ncbi:hypothetical protein Q5762_13360 [Streptomyces sp. P9(2023)]|uniref:hypothetical protein n=1 Tax=Streptomyces sp. P9(2023) TaxID=3064394 RepID=UPI0028F3F8F2|nr:hypothetical protein [Streptomyces sp. P9(2023)]MDT9689309.1 hypothetical protein [Streptomyces sp. P9(2023)]